MLKGKKVIQHLSYFRNQHGAAREVFATYMHDPFFTFIHHKQIFKGLVSQLQFSVYIELF